MRKTALIFAILLVILVSGCANYGGNQTTSGGDKVVIQNFAFSPSTLTLKAGTTVTWTNEDSVAHTVNSGTFNSETLNKGDSFQYTFNTAGTYDYICGIHPSMKGKIVVE